MTDVFTKRPDTLLDYKKDWSDWLGADTISESIWSVPTGLTKESDSKTPTGATIWISGGVDGEDYLVINGIVTIGGRQEQAYLILQVRSAPGTILSRAEAATVLRCEQDDPNMIDLLSLVDGYIRQATGRDWSKDMPIRSEARSAARMLLVRWHEDPGGMAAGAAMGFGLTACLVQLEALALRYKIFAGGNGAGAICLPGAHLGDTVSSLVGKVGASGDQSAAFEAVITFEGQIQQVSTADLSDHWYQVHLVPPEALP